MPTNERTGRPSLYGSAMTLTKFHLADEHRAMLNLVAARTGRTRASLIREALEVHLPGLLLQRPEPATTTGEPAGGNPTGSESRSHVDLDLSSV